MKKVKINKRIYGTVIICPDTFREIKHYVETYYDECSIVIERQYGVDECDSLNHAYILMRKYTDTITKITITAHKGENIFTICYNNQPQVGKATLTIKAEIDKDMVEMFNNFGRITQVPPKSSNTKIRMWPSLLMNIAVVVLIKSIFDLLPDKFEYIALGGLIAALLIWSAVSSFVLPAVKAKNKGEKLIEFWTEQQMMEAIEKRIINQNRKNTERIVISILLIALSAYIIYSMAVGG